MPSVAELYGSRVHRGRGGDTESVSLLYRVLDTPDDLVALSAVQAAAPATYDGIPLAGIDLEPIHVDSSGGDGFWQATALYETSTTDEVDETAQELATYRITTTVRRDELPAVRTSFSLSTEQARVNTSYETLSTLGNDDFAGMINADENGVQGVDIHVPVGQFSVTKVLPVATVDAYRSTWSIATGTINNGTFYGYGAGELLFAGVDAQPWFQKDELGVVQTYYDCTFTFLYRRTETWTSPLGGVTKRGWDYYWAHYHRLNPQSEGMPVYGMDGSYVERMYQETNFGSIIP